MQPGGISPPSRRPGVAVLLPRGNVALVLHFGLVSCNLPRTETPRMETHVMPARVQRLVRHAHGRGLRESSVARGRADGAIVPSLKGIRAVCCANRRVRGIR